MNIFKSKVVVACSAFIVLVVLGYVALNSDYFLKQVKFWFNKPQAATNQNTVEGEKGESNRIIIPSLGINAPIVESAENNESAFQEALKKGVVHYPGTADVGQLGNPYLFGHSSDFALKGGDYKTVFALLPQIEKGAEVVVTNGEGQIFRYEVTDSFVAKSTDIHLLDQKEYKEKLLTIQTSYPIGTALKRWIVTAKLKE